MAESNRLQTVEQVRSSYGDYEASQVALTVHGWLTRLH